MAAGKKLLRDSSMDEETDVREKMESLRTKSDAVATATNERLGSLEQALPLARSFQDTHSELDSWLGEVEPQLAQLATLTVDVDQVKRQQETVKVMVIKSELRGRDTLCLVTALVVLYLLLAGFILVFFNILANGSLLTSISAFCLFR